MSRERVGFLSGGTVFTQSVRTVPVTNRMGSHGRVRDFMKIPYRPGLRVKLVGDDPGVRLESEAILRADESNSGDFLSRLAQWLAEVALNDRGSA